jgi:hypothetical protein
MNLDRALCVIRRVKHAPTGVYEAWLHHDPVIRVQCIGIGLTRDFLQAAVNALVPFPTNVGSPADLETALNTDGEEVMVFHVVQNRVVTVGSHLSESGAFVISSPPKPAPKIEPPTEPAIPMVPKPRVPLPPIAKPFWPTDADTLCLGYLHDEHKKMIVSCFASDATGYKTPAIKMLDPNTSSLCKKIEIDLETIRKQATVIFGTIADGASSKK